MEQFSAGYGRFGSFSFLSIVIPMSAWFGGLRQQSKEIQKRFLVSVFS
jgi:hypothetical protein